MSEWNELPVELVEADTINKITYSKTCPTPVIPCSLIWQKVQKLDSTYNLTQEQLLPPFLIRHLSSPSIGQGAVRFTSTQLGTLDFVQGIEVPILRAKLCPLIFLFDLTIVLEFELCVSMHGISDVFGPHTKQSCSLYLATCDNHRPKL